VLSLLLDALAPPACLACCSPLETGGLCGRCRASLPRLRDPCPRCALPREAGRCQRCPAGRAAFSQSWAAVAHAGTGRDVVLALKLRGALGAADVMAAQIVAGAPAWLRGGALVPVPAAAARRRRRGFDPAGELAAALGRRTGSPVVRCLARRSADGRQVGRRRHERRSAREAIRVAAEAPDRVVLVDDVHTTGATLQACASALASAGSAQIRAVTYARTLRRA
jgi:predicted amidophosphoribosyltransferase